jgi:hypothetical protein
MEKTFEGYILLNWKSGKVSVRKTFKKSSNPFEIPVKFIIKVVIPEPKEVVARGEIVVPEQQVKEMVVEEL